MGCRVKKQSCGVVIQLTLTLKMTTPHRLSKRQSLPTTPEAILPYKRLMGMCHWMESHFHDWIDYNEVAFSIELLEWGRTFSDS